MKKEVEKALDAAEHAQESWASLVARQRLKVVGRIAAKIAASQTELVDAIERPNANRAEILASEVLPLADACRFASRVGRQVLAPKNHSIMKGAWWMGWIRVATSREPWGSVLIVSPSNYPLFLPGVQIIQAIAAGNAALVKPAPGGTRVLEVLLSCLKSAGVPEDLVRLLPETIEAGQEAIRQGVDKVVLTGSVHTGRAVMRELSETLTPSTMELSGCDAAFVLPQADIKRTAKAIAYGMTLNGGATCIAPRRIFVTRDNRKPLSERLIEELKQLPRREFEIEPATTAMLLRVVEQALAKGASILYGELPTNPKATRIQAIVLKDVDPQMEVARADLFAPITSLIPVEDMTAAVSSDHACPYSLGASVFGPRPYANHWASEIAAGCVVINDVVVPTADPRVPFGGHDHSGWGVTRGAEGLLEMTRVKTVCTRVGNWLPHLDRENSADESTLVNLLQLFHGSSLKSRFQALREIVQRGKKQREKK